MAQTITELKSTVFGDVRIRIINFVANGTASGSYTTGMDFVYGAWPVNTENHSEDIKIVMNSNDGTENTVAGDIYITAPDGSNNTAKIFIIGF
jgi:hypothetical protein